MKLKEFTKDAFIALEEDHCKQYLCKKNGFIFLSDLHLQNMDGSLREGSIAPGYQMLPNLNTGACLYVVNTFGRLTTVRYQCIPINELDEIYLVEE